MIGYLKGHVLAIHEQTVLLDVHDVGYEVLVSARAALALPAKGNSLALFIYHHVREDAQVLFGFQSLLEKQLFLLLTSVSGVGPKSALSFLSGLSATELIQAIYRSDTALISSAQGVGKKTAEKVVLELKDKVAKNFPDALAGQPKPSGMRSVSSTLEQGFKDELVEALKALGYSAKEVETVLLKNDAQLAATESVEQALTLLLKHI